MTLMLMKMDQFPYNDRLECLALAPPPTYRGDVEESDAAKITVYVNHKDCVPWLHLEAIKRLLSEADENWKNQLERRGMGVMDFESPVEFEIIGKIYYLLPNDHGSQYHLIESKAEKRRTFSERVFISNGMLRAHLQMSYDDAFKNTSLV